MSLLLVATLVLLGLGSVLLQWKNDKRLVSIFYVLFSSVLIQWAASEFNNEASLAFHFLTVGIVLAYLTSQFLPKKQVYGALISTVIVLAVYFISGGVEMTLNEITSRAESKFVVVGIVLASVAPYLIHIKLRFIGNWIDALNASAWTVAVYPLLAGVGFLLSSLTAPVYGPMLIGTALLINSFFSDKRSGITSVSIYVLAVIPLVLVDQKVSMSLLFPDVIAGLLLGGFSVFLLNKLWSGNRNLILTVIAYFIVFGTIVGFTYAGTVFEQMGGVDTFTAILIGGALVHSIKGKRYQGITLFAPALAFSLFIPSLLINEELEKAENDIIVIGQNAVSKEGDAEKGPVVLPITELSGMYTVNNNASLVQFELGEEGARTKGQFKKVSGSFNITDDLSKASVNVSMKMKDFTTFNKMRDKSLQDDDYFNSDKYPTLKFTGAGFIDRGNDLFEVKGNFIMLGKTREVSVTLQRIELEDKIVLVGSGSLDRTDFGMTPSAAEGNVVDFNYQVELYQK